MALNAFRRSAAAEAKSGGKGFKGGWYDKKKLPKGTPVPFVLIRGDYVDPNPPAELQEIDPATGRPKDIHNFFQKIKNHKRKYMKNGRESYAEEPCSAGNDPHNPKPCVGCSAMDQGDKTVSLADLFSFGIFDLSVYHGVPYIVNGQVKMKQDNSGPVIIYEECEGRTCNYCRVLQGQPPILQQGEVWPNIDPRSISTTFGRRRYIQIGKGHLSDLDGWEQVVSSQCQNVIVENGYKRVCGAQLITDGYRCPNCKNMVIDMANDPRTDAQIQDAVMRPYPCMTCQRPVLLEEVVSCDACGNAVQTSIFDGMVLWGMRQGEGTKSHLVMQKAQSLEEFEAQLPGHIKQLLGGKSLKSLIDELAKPYDFDKMFEPRSLEDQAKRLELPVPQQYAPQGYAGPQAQYGGQPQQGQPQGQQFVTPPQFAAYPPQAGQPQGQPQQGQPGPAPFLPQPPPNYGRR